MFCIAIGIIYDVLYEKQQDFVVLSLCLKTEIKSSNTCCPIASIPLIQNSTSYQETWYETKQSKFI